MSVLLSKILHTFAMTGIPTIGLVVPIFTKHSDYDEHNRRICTKNQDKNQQASAMTGIPTIGLVKHSKNHTHICSNNLVTHEKCSICLVEMYNHVSLPCGHNFHRKCLNRLSKMCWESPRSLNITTCPNCRREFVHVYLNDYFIYFNIDLYTLIYRYDIELDTEFDIDFE